MSNLVIVESPTKARTLSRFLGKDYQIEASMGHIRDLPKGSLGVEVENNFEPGYVIPKDKRKKVGELKKAAARASELWLATDPDREGEAIAWHLSIILKNTKQKIHRVEFHEITEEAIKEAFKKPRQIDIKLVDAQQARRVLDRLVGYKLSPLLWKKIKRGLSAGRVQTVALRLIVEREREVLAFIPVEYWSIDAEFNSEFLGTLVEVNNKKVEIKSEAEAKTHTSFLKSAQFKITKITKKEARRSPPPPFTTSTLQQTAGNRLSMSAKRIMMIAQNLYEHGLITYMRTDSVNLAPQAVVSAREFIEKKYGKNYLPGVVRKYTSKSKNAQEAHEAIRPTDASLVPDSLNVEGFSRDHRRLYELIWKRMMASQMMDAIFDQTGVDIKASPNYLFRANGSVLKFDGWLKVYGREEDLEDEKEDSKNQILPEDLKETQILDLTQLFPKQHFTQPPPRYTEASLIKKLEELGIGRPSTYAPILSTIQERFYVTREERKFMPTDLGISVTDFLIKYFPDVFDYEFTALMEDRLDEIALGKREWRQTISSFYQPIEKRIEETMETAERIEMPVEVTDKICPECRKNLIVRLGKFGKFLACSGFPDCKHTQTLEETIDAKCPSDGGDVLVRKTRKGKIFYGCKNYPQCTYASWTKPK